MFVFKHIIKTYRANGFDLTMFFCVCVFECFILAELYKLVVKTVCKLAYKQILVAIYLGKTKAAGSP